MSNNNTQNPRTLFGKVVSTEVQYVDICKDLFQSEVGGCKFFASKDENGDETDFLVAFNTDRKIRIVVHRDAIKTYTPENNEFTVRMQIKSSPNFGEFVEVFMLPIRTPDWEFGF